MTSTPLNSNRLSKSLALFLSLFALSFFFLSTTQASEADTRKILVDLVNSESSTEDTFIEALSDKSDAIIAEMVEAWRAGRISSITNADDTTTILLKNSDETYQSLLDGSAVTPATEPKIDRPSRGIKKKLRRVVTLLELNDPDIDNRINAAERLGMSQKAEYIEILRSKVDEQPSSRSKKAFESAIAASLLANGTEEEKLEAVKTLGENKALKSKSLLEDLQKEYTEIPEVKENADAMMGAINTSLSQLESHQNILDWTTRIFSGVSAGSILLLVSYGLAITFGQMGVINMAHGEFIAIGGYTAYLLQKYFETNYGVNSEVYGYYFIIALPCSFIVAAIAGAILEKGLIQFLYSRPLESLLATWGVSMILQQAFRTYNSANVSVSSPEWLSGSQYMLGINMPYNRLFQIGCALALIIITWLLMNRTKWGLHVRATMQNRQMSSNLGVPSGRVNMLTFAFGSGLAGLAGALISQTGNVGPEMGGTYIVDSFMVVVTGGVGNLFGTAIAAMGIGVTDNLLQPYLGTVMGKITVLFAVILFLQFRPGGLFPSRSRSLDD